MMTNELDRAIATINRHLLYSKLCAIFIQNGNVKSCLQMMGIDLDTADEEPTQQMNSQLNTPPELSPPSPDNSESSTSETTSLYMETNEESPPPETGSSSSNVETTQPPMDEKPKRRGRKKKKEVEKRGDEFDEAYRKAYSEVMKDDDKNGQTNG